MDAQWKKIGRPVAVGFLVGLLLSGAIASLSPAPGPERPAVGARGD